MIKATYYFPLFQVPSPRPSLTNSGRWCTIPSCHSPRRALPRSPNQCWTRCSSRSPMSNCSLFSPPQCLRELRDPNFPEFRTTWFRLQMSKLDSKIVTVVENFLVSLKIFPSSLSKSRKNNLFWLPLGKWTWEKLLTFHLGSGFHSWDIEHLESAQIFERFLVCFFSFNFRHGFSFKD